MADLGPAMVGLAGVAVGGVVTGLTSYGLERLKFTRQRQAVDNDRTYEAAERRRAFQREATKMLADQLAGILSRFNAKRAVDLEEAAFHAEALCARLDDAGLRNRIEVWLLAARVHDGLTGGELRDIEGTHRKLQTMLNARLRDLQ